jgi:hypothetical protein
VAPQPVPAPAPARPAAVIPAQAPAPVSYEDEFESNPAPEAPLPPVRAAEPAAEPASQRRRFARPNGAAAQSLNDSLNGAFSPEPPAAPAPAVPQRSAAPAQESPFAFAPVGNGHQPARQPAYPGYQQQAAASPFAFADETLTEAPAASQPAPFTFLTQNGEGHFSPKPTPVIPPQAPAISAYDALEDTPLPWMQPASARR